MFCVFQMSAARDNSLSVVGKRSCVLKISNVLKKRSYWKRSCDVKILNVLKDLMCPSHHPLFKEVFNIPLLASLLVILYFGLFNCSFFKCAGFTLITTICTSVLVYAKGYFRWLYILPHPGMIF